MYQKKQVFLGRESQEGLVNGVNILADAVKSTLGPKGRYVVISHQGKYFVTKDGVTVAKSIHLENPLADMGAQLVKQAAAKTGTVAGDGTTTATVIAQAIIREAMLLLSRDDKNYNAIDIKNAIETVLPEFIKFLKQIAIPVQDYDMIEHVANISTNNDPFLAKLIRQAYEKVTFNGIIAVEESRGSETEVVMVEGMEFDGGYFSSTFATDPKTLHCNYDDVKVLIVDGKINNATALVRLLDQCVREGKALMIIADELDVQSMATLNINKIQGKIKVVAVRPPLWGTKRRDYLYDIAVLTGGNVISEVSGLSIDKIDISYLGSCDKIKVTNRSTTIMGGKGTKEMLDQRIETIRALKDVEITDWGKNKIDERIAKLSTGVALVKVGGLTEAEMKEKKDRIEDAIYACRAAIEEGCVIGGGVIPYYWSSVKSNQEDELSLVLYRALQEPFKAICANAGYSNDTIDFLGKELVKTINENDSFEYGINIAEGETGINAWKEGIIDPVKVIRVALENAVSIAGMILTSQCAIADVPRKDDEAFDQGLSDDADQYDPELIGMN